ncbi:ERMES complex subunit mmm1 [Coemansia biformis]|uniref:Maintenance of mitochondrial morphology protein 1 n=1 Tax=Coemansia biformis TaxID=1286918 RepID=A0A9W7Y9N8_9FUNG|nr:ERMES complex subunit mmm1 [Coemansia biformis]
MESAAGALVGALSPTLTALTAAISSTLAAPDPTASDAAQAAMSAASSHAARAAATDGVHGAARAWLSALSRCLSSWQPTFMQGFILGQVSMLVLLVVAIKYVLFEEPLGRREAGANGAHGTADDAAAADVASSEAAKRGTIVHEGGLGLSRFTIFSRKPKEPQPGDVAEELARMHKEILTRTGYDLAARGPETCDWLTVFLAQFIAKFRADAERHDRLVRVISEALNGALRPSAIDNIRITQFSLGSDFLRVTGARMVPSAGPLKMRAELDLALHDEITLGFNTRVLVNWPRPTLAALPVSMVVSLVKFAGTLAVTFDCAAAEPSLSVSILPDYVLEFDVQTLIGSKAKVQNLPMLTSVICRKLQAAFAKELVMPNGKQIQIKHPFMSKAADPAAAADSAGVGNAAPAQSGRTQSPGPPAMPPQPLPQSRSAQHAPRSPDIGDPRPLSPIGPLVAELPPDYNTQLPPPHPLRITPTSRAAVPNTSTSPPTRHPPRVVIPDEPLAASGHTPRTAVSSSLQQQQYLRPWSPDSMLYPASPHLRPIVGMSSASALGPTVAGSRILNAGPRLPGGHSALLHPFGLALAPGSQATQPPAAPAGADHDDLQVKDSVRQRVSRAIKTVNEA